MRTDKSYQPCVFVKGLPDTVLGGVPVQAAQLSPPSIDLYTFVTCPELLAGIA